MFGALNGLGIAGSIGALFGMLLVLYIKPTEKGGVAFLIALPIIICGIIGGVIGGLRGNKEKKNDKSQTEKDDDQNDSKGDDAAE